MKHDEMWEAAKLAAEEIVQAEKDLWPNAEGVVAFSTGGGSTDSSFRRYGTSAQDISTQLPTLLSDLLSSNANTSAPDAGLSSASRNYLTGLLTRNQDATPGESTLTGTMAIDPTTFTGSSSLGTMAARNPYSSSFETSTQAAYEQRAADALAQLQTGHEAVRGGQSRSGIAQGIMSDRLAQGRGQEVRQAQLQDAGIVQGASGIFGGLENARRGAQLQAQSQYGGQSAQRNSTAVEGSRSADVMRSQHSGALDLASKYLGLRKGLNTDDLGGYGNQGTSSWGVNILGGCCFIFLEALNGTLPWYVEAARFEFLTPTRRLGYKWMSSWLVPAMRKWKVVRFAVNATIVKPCLLWGAYHYTSQGTRLRAWLKPYVFGLFKTWDLIGLVLMERNK